MIQTYVAKPGVSSVRSGSGLHVDRKTEDGEKNQAIDGGHYLDASMHAEIRLEKGGGCGL
jgi:hypothetical protein